MTGRDPKRSFASRPGDAESWVQGAGTSAGRSRWGRIVHRPSHHRRHARASRPHQGRRVPARRHRRRHAARPSRRANSLKALETRHEQVRRRFRVAGPRPIDALTHVELTWIEKRIEHWIRFGHDVAEKILDRRRRVFSFAPGSIFAFVRWASNDFGTVVSRIDILRAVAAGEAYRPCPTFVPAARFCCASTAGRRLSACFKRSTPWSDRRRSLRRRA